MITVPKRYRQTDGRTDDMQSQYRALHYSASRGKNWLRSYTPYSTGAASTMKSPPKILIVMSDNYQVTLTTLHIIKHQCNCLNITHQFSPRRAAIHATGRLPCPRCNAADQTMQQSGRFRSAALIMCDKHALAGLVYSPL